MAVVPMSRISVYGLTRDRKPILEALQRYGVLEIADVKCDGLSELDTSAMQTSFLKAAETAEKALSVLEQYAPEKTSITDMFAGKREIGAAEYYKYVDEIDEIMRAAGELVSLSKDIAEKTADNVRLGAQIEALTPWKNFDLPLQFKGTRKTAVFTGTISNLKTTEEIIERLGFPDAEVGVVSTSPEQTCIYAVCSVWDAEQLEESLRTLGFSRCVLSTKGTPMEEIGRIESVINENLHVVSDNVSKIESYAGFRNAFKFSFDYYNMRVEKYKALSQIGIGKKTFVLCGYLPGDSAEDFAAALEKNYNAAVEIEPADDAAPVLLKNNGFAEPVEGVVESYSMPGKGEADPTGIMAIFYYVLFGIMLADFGYGLIMAIACGFLVKKFPDMEKGLKRSLKMFGYCGISTAFWGLMFGGCFGDAVTVISTTFFGKTVNFPALLFAPLDDVMAMLLLSFAIGVIHLFAGLFMKLLQCIKTGAVMDGIYDVVFWYFLVGGGICWLLSTSAAANMLGISPLPTVAGRVGMILAVIGAAGIVLFAGRSSKNPGKRIAKGLYELYGVTSYLSDILSYSRLLALGLASGVIAQVFNRMGSMAGNGVFGAIVFILVFVVGHTLNIGINLLGAYVHTNRLQFVEFFGKFYEGGGRLYKPFSENTKYFNIREDF